MLTSNQVAEIAGVSARAVRQWCEAGRRGNQRIIAYRVGRDWILAAEECQCGRLVPFQDHTLKATCDKCGYSVRYVGPFGE